MSQIAELEARKAELRSQYGSSTNIQERQNMLDEINKIEKQITELANREDAGQAAAEALFSEFDNIVVDDLQFTLREMCLTEGHYQVLSQWLQIREANRAEEHAAIVSSYKSQVESLEAENESLEQNRKRAIELEDKLADMEMKRDAAGEELRIANEEVRRLTQDNESLRKQLETKQSRQSGPIDTAEFKRQAEELHKLKPAITSKRWKDEMRKNTYLAELVETGETIEIPYLNINQYREVTAEEANRFRAEAAEKAAAAHLADSALVDTPSITISYAEVPEHSPYGEVDDEPVTRKEFDALAARVAQLEQSKVNAA